MRNTLALAAGVAALALMATSSVPAAAASGQTPFKLGTFQAGGRKFVALVLNDTRALDMAQANAAYQRAHPSAAKVAIPTDMRDVIAAYDNGLGARLRQIANAEAGGRAAPYAHAISGLKILPPVMPQVILNAGANYPEHLAGIGAEATRAAAAGQVGAGAGAGVGPESVARPAGAGAAPGGRPAAAAAAPAGAVTAPGLWEHPASDPRPDNPYFFLKSPTVVVGADDNVVVPFGRVQLDWECEFAVVVGKTAKRVSVADAPNYVFGYTIEFDASDRGNRGDRKMGGGPDWFIQKNHDTFGPVGPFIVPKEFFPDPKNTRHFFALNGEIKQDSNTNRMGYDIYEGLSFGSNVLTLHPGDLLSMGSPAGTNIERQNPRWMKAGDMGVCTVEGVGVQHHHIVDEK